MNLTSLQKLVLNVSHERWQNEFSQQEKIGRGGFASVYKALNKLDENYYAIKRIKLRARNMKACTEEDLEKILNESKFLAKVSHQNVLRYYNSWLEMTIKPKTSTPVEVVQGGNVFTAEELSRKQTSENPEGLDTHDTYGELDFPTFEFQRSVKEETKKSTATAMFTGNGETTESTIEHCSGSVNPLKFKSMLAFNPTDRPSLETISQSLKLPIELETQLSGTISLRTEDSLTWNDKHFKLIDSNLYIYRKEQDKKAEIVYNLVEWNVSLRRPEDESTLSTEADDSLSETSNCASVEGESTWIALEDPSRLGCSFKKDNNNATMKLYHRFNKTKF